MHAHKDNLSAIFYDFDDVLADSLKIKADAFLSLFTTTSKQHREAIENHFYRYTGHSRQEKLKHIYQHILGQTLSDQLLNDLCEQFQQRSLEAVIASPEINGANAMLNAIPSHIPCFVVSGTPEEELRKIIDARGMGEHFVEIRGTPTTKATNIAELLEKHQLMPEQCIMFGDGIVDMEAANLNSMPFIGIVKEGHQSPFPSDTQICQDLLAAAKVLEFI